MGGVIYDTESCVIVLIKYSLLYINYLTNSELVTAGNVLGFYK